MSIPVQTRVIKGELVAPVSGRYIDLINPLTGEIAGCGAAGDAADVAVAVAAVKQAFTSWKETSSSERAVIISRMGLVLGANLEQLVALEASCTGLSAARLMSFDIPGVMQFFQTFAENLEDYAFVEYPPVRTIAEAYDVKIVKQPLGFCGLIPAWNGPLFLSFVKALPAIAAETASLAVVRAVELLRDVVPPGVINVVTGLGHTAGAALASHPDVAKISFTGSGRTGSLIQKMAADTMKRVTPDMRIYREEIFGPVLSVISYSDVQEAIALANDSCYGLSAGICTGDPIAAQSLAHAMASAKLIVRNQPQVVANGQDLMARQNMLNASASASASASAMACNAVQADCGAVPVHNFAHAIGALFPIHHGEANAVFLPTVLEEMPEFYLPVADRLKDTFGVLASDPQAIVLETARVIRGLMAEMALPQDCSRHNIPESALADIVTAVAHDPVAAFYPLGRDVIEKICRKVCGW